MSNRCPEIDSFRDILQKLTSCFDTVVTTALAFRGNDGTWKLARALTVLYFGELFNLETVELRTKSILAFRRFNTITEDDAQNVVAGLLANPFTISRGTEALGVHSEEKATMRFQFYPFHPRFGRQNLRVCGLRGEVDEPKLVLDRSRLDLEPAAHQEPYDGLSELLQALDLNFEGDETD